MLPKMHYEEAGKCQIEGARLALMASRPRGFSYDQAFLYYFQAFLNLKEFKPSFVPFFDRPIGLTQILPKSIYLCEKDICLGYYGMTEPHFHNFLKTFKGDNYDINPFKFEFSSATTKEFSQWWELCYQGHLVNELLLITAVRNGFEESILNKIKSKLNARGKSFRLVNSL
jgi:hypothetical protein